jgi:hypothetical protein
MRSQTYVGALALSVVLVNSPPAFGQSPKGSVSATYTLLRDSESAYTFGRGISVGGAYRLCPWVFVGAELALSSHHQDYSSSHGGTYDIRYQSLQAGPRFSPDSGRVQPYAEVLIGATRLGVWERLLDNVGEWGSPEFSVQPGLGVEVLIGRRVALRLGGDLRLLFRHDTRFDKGYRTNLYRLNTGLALRLGGS